MHNLSKRPTLRNLSSPSTSPSIRSPPAGVHSHHDGLHHLLGELGIGLLSIFGNPNSISKKFYQSYFCHIFYFLRQFIVSEPVMAHQKN
jgi:hypothetical protein